jgi:RNA polymerase primary sigma factor
MKRKASKKAIKRLQALRRTLGSAVGKRRRAPRVTPPGRPMGARRRQPVSPRVAERIVEVRRRRTTAPITTAPLETTIAARLLQQAPAPLAPELGAHPDDAGADATAIESVAEAEAAAEPDEEEAAEEPEAGEAVEAPVAPTATSTADDERANFLALYFKEMARLNVLRPEEEFEAARRIEEVEIELWGRITGFVPVLEHVLKVVERTIDNSVVEFRHVRRRLAELRKRPALKREVVVRAAAVKATDRVRALDIDKRILDAVLTELRRIARGDAVRLIDEKLPFSPRGREFRRYYHGVAQVEARMLRAKNAFVKANLRLVVSIARRFNHGRMPLADLIQEGNIGLIKAVERFDYHRGFRFSTYASWWIRHAISRALADKGRAVRLPVHMIDAYHRVARSRRELSSKLGRQPTSEEIAASAGIPAAKVEKMRSYLLDQSFSLDRTVSDEDGRKFIEFVTDPNPAPPPSDRLIDHAMSTEVRSLLTQLKPIEADILRQRFGLDNDEELTLKEIGEKYNLSRERIRQLQEQALGKMRRALQRKDLM